MYVVTDRRDLRDRRNAFIQGGPLLSMPGDSPVQGSKGEAATFTRANVKNSTDGTKQVGSGLPLVEAKGILLEPSHTNRMQYSEDLTHWNLRGTCVVTPGQADPRGGTTACLVSGIIASVAGDLYTTSGGGVSGPNTYSFFIKRVSTSGVIGMANAGGSAWSWHVDMSLLPDGWVRVDANHPAVTVVTPWASDTGTSGVQVFRFSGASPLSFYLWGVDVDSGDVLHSYYGPTTTGNATSAADVLAFTGLSLPGNCRVVLDFTPQWPSFVGFRALFDSRVAGVSGVALYIDASGTLIAFFEDASSSSTMTKVGLTWTKGQTYRVELRWDGAGNASMYRDGVLLTSGTSQKLPGAMVRLAVGSLYDGSDSCDGHIANLYVQAG